MEALEIRNELHEYIDNANDKELATIYELIQGTRHSYKYTPEEIAMFEERRARYLRGEGKSYTVEESMERIRKNRP